jgi:hypothetical protein
VSFRAVYDIILKNMEEAQQATDDSTAQKDDLHAG